MKEEQVFQSGIEGMKELFSSNLKDKFERYSFVFLPTILSSITASIFIKSELLAEISAKMLGLKIKTELPEYVDFVTRNKEGMENLDIESEIYLKDCCTYANSIFNEIEFEVTEINNTRVILPKKCSFL